jgi:hypothetical protein
MPQQPEVILQIQRRNTEDESPTAIGKVSVGERGKLTLVDCDPAFAAAIKNVVEAVNGKDKLRVKSPPPPEADPTGIVWRSVERDDPELLEALGEYLRQKYDLYLVPEKAP